MRAVFAIWNWYSYFTLYIWDLFQVRCFVQVETLLGVDMRYVSAQTEVPYQKHFLNQKLSIFFPESVFSQHGTTSPDSQVSK